MSDIKCPFCQQELEYCGTYIDGTKKLWCDNCKLFGDNRLFEKLIRTRKALEVAKNAINSAADHNIINCVARGIDPRTDDVSVTLCNALERITALEQKDK